MPAKLNDYRSFAGSFFDQADNSVHTMDLSSARLAIIGLGYVGLPLAVEFGKHRSVLGFDINTARIAELQAGRDSTLEVEPHDLATASQLRFSSQSTDLKDCQVFIVTVPTPVDQATYCGS